MKSSLPKSNKRAWRNQGIYSKLGRWHALMVKTQDLKLGQREVNPTYQMLCDPEQETYPQNFWFLNNAA